MILLSILFKQCASDIVYRLVKSRSPCLGSRVMVSLNRLLSNCLDHLNLSFLVFIDSYFNGPAWCVTPIRPFICCGTTLRYLTLKRLGFRQGRGIAYADFVKLQNNKNMKFIFSNNKNKQRRRLWVSHNSRLGYLTAKLFSVNCAYFLNVTQKRPEIKCASVS